jgi:hypothetical protein
MYRQITGAWNLLFGCFNLTTPRREVARQQPDFCNIKQRKTTLVTSANILFVVPGDARLMCPRQVITIWRLNEHAYIL